MLQNLIIRPVDETILDAVRREIDIKTKPPGSLGRLEELAIQMAGAQNTRNPAADPAELLLFAGDHGLVEEGVSAWPSEVTAQMVMNFLAGGAAANVFARSNNVRITVVDAGVASDLPDDPGLIRAGIRKGTRNAMNEPALTADEVTAALEFGSSLAMEKVSNGARTIALGEMGIGNTSSATLVAAALTGHTIAELAGPGAGLDIAGLDHKTKVLITVIGKYPENQAPVETLANFGGLEIAMMSGALIGAAAANALVLVDGFIATAAALAALKARPEALPYTVFAHRSKEPGHRLILHEIGAEPLVDLDLRLGEGSGALLAVPLLRNACAMLAEMATFEDAGVTNKD